MAPGRLVYDSAMESLPPITITHARFRDLSQVRALQLRAFPAKLAYGMPTLLLLWAMPGAVFLLAKRENALLGCAIGDRSGDVSRVVNLAVDPDVRRQGIGRLLLHELERSLPTGDMILMVQEENDAAQALYEHTGYRHVGVSRNYYGKGKNGLWMRKVRTRSGGDRIFV